MATQEGATTYLGIDSTTNTSVVLRAFEQEVVARITAKSEDKLQKAIRAEQLQHTNNELEMKLKFAESETAHAREIAQHMMVGGCSASGRT